MKDMQATLPAFDHNQVNVHESLYTFQFLKKKNASVITPCVNVMCVISLANTAKRMIHYTLLC